MILLVGGPLVELRLGGVFLSVLALLSQYGELDCEENKLEERLLDKQ